MFGEVGGSLCFVPFEPHHIIVNTICMYVKVWRVFRGRDNGEGKGLQAAKVRRKEHIAEDGT
jgi:hypothetical protein